MVNTRSQQRQSGVFVPRQPVPPAGYSSRLVDNYLQYDCLLTPDELQRLGDHKYSAMDTSWLDEFCMKKFWERVVEYYPLWLAPNVITLVGLLVNLFTVVVLSRYVSTATEDAPRWAYLLSALGLFFYQTLDATDGKQARRIGASSPLGELFDHGCDSISQIFVTLSVCLAMHLGSVRAGVFLTCAFSMALFYCAHWSTYCTGQLRFNRFDVTEAQMTVIAVLVTTAIFGPRIWDIGVAGFQLKHLVVGACMCGAIYQLNGYLIVCLNGGVGKNGSTVAGTSVLFPICPLLACVIPFAMIYSKSNSDVFDKNICMFMLCYGAVCAKATNRVIVAHMSRSELVLWDWIYLGPIALILNQYYDFVFNEGRLLFWVTVYCYASLLIYCVVITRQLCDHLRIECFRVTKRAQ